MRIPFTNLFLIVLFVVKTKCTLPEISDEQSKEDEAYVTLKNENSSDEKAYIRLKYSSYFSACSLTDTMLSECIEDNIREGGATFAKGIPELGVPPLDPLSLGIIKLNNPTLKIIFSEAELKGLSNFELNSFNISLEDNKASLDFTANVTLNGHYSMDGQVLLLPVKGDGRTKIKITNLNIKIKYRYEIRDGFWRIVYYKETHMMDKARFKFTNLFGGQNPELAKTFHSIVNENWQVVMDEIAPEVTTNIIGICVDTVGKFYAAVPASELLKAK